jgi:hypothetical protein
LPVSQMRTHARSISLKCRMKRQPDVPLKGKHSGAFVSINAIVKKR